MENELITKELKKKTRNIIISSIILVIGIALLGYGLVNANNMKNNPYNLAEYGWDNTTTDELVYLDITKDPIQLTEAIDGEAYYVLMDDDYYYIGYMKVKTAEETKAPKRLMGTTALPEHDLQVIAIDTLMEVFEDQSIKYDDYQGIFGSVYMNTLYSIFDLSPFSFMMGISITIAGLIAFFINLSNSNKFKKSISDLQSLRPGEYENIITEMNSSNQYYKDLNVIVTDNYIVSLNSNKLEAVNYKDMIWIYKYEYRYNGAKTNENLKVQTKDGIIHDVAIASGGLKSKDKAYAEIMNTVKNKNSKVLLGYTQDNVNLANSMINK